MKGSHEATSRHSRSRAAQYRRSSASNSSYAARREAPHRSEASSLEAATISAYSARTWHTKNWSMWLTSASDGFGRTPLASLLQNRTSFASSGQTIVSTSFTGSSSYAISHSTLKKPSRWSRFGTIVIPVTSAPNHRGSRLVSFHGYVCTSSRVPIAIRFGRPLCSCRCSASALRSRCCCCCCSFSSSASDERPRFFATSVAAVASTSISPPRDDAAAAAAASRLVPCGSICASKVHERSRGVISAAWWQHQSRAVV
mmetsp:Transcript_8752/g.27534  ORF Transcript_8752/g.27534 Transcript_8752/m.27534 type:complete len:257 (+) Transcript_8752:139-909(+)